ncbi:MAG TPA: alpha/beta fold hydrolase [Chthoniobacterales bacterium]|nr:alpha/beta fold hydrolase [Chthoniobacterales bacterium]
MMNRKEPLVFLLLTAWVVGTSSAQTTENRPTNSSSRIQNYTLEKVVSHHARVQYVLSLPKGYAGNSDRYPLILYLHGGSVRGSDITKMKRLGVAQKAEADPNFPFIVVSPQCHPGEIWTDMDGLAAVVDEVMATCRVDPDRVYVAGHSMGGRGALYAAYKMPGRFAAVLSLSPVCPITGWAEKLSAIPLWVFHGANDQFTTVKEIKELVDAVVAAGGHPQFTLFPDRDHYILDVFDRPDVLKWLAEQRRKSPQ